MPSVGVIAIAPSFKNPLLTKWVANPDEDGWVTVENRLALPIDVTPAFADGSQEVAYGFTVPAMMRSTVPILKDRGVQFSCFNPTPTNGNTAPAAVGNNASGVPFGLASRSNASGNTIGRYVGKNNVPYMLHDNGGAPSEPVYPVESLLCSVQSEVILASQSPTFWVGYNSIGNPSTNVDAYGPVDMCIVAQTFQLQALNFTGATEQALVQYIYDRDAPFPNPQLEGGTVIATNVTPIGSTLTVDARGAVGYTLGIAGGAGTDTCTVNIIDWIGSPGA